MFKNVSCIIISLRFDSRDNRKSLGGCPKERVRKELVRKERSMKRAQYEKSAV